MSQKRIFNIGGFKYVLFDMDGTLTDTVFVGEKNFIKYLGNFGVKVSRADKERFDYYWRRMIVKEQSDFLIRFAKNHDVEMVSEKSFIIGFYDSYVRLISEAPPLPGVSRLLEEIHQKDGIKMALVTSSNADQVNGVLTSNNWLKYFDVLITKYDVENIKPDPEPYLLALEKLSASKGETVVIEDSQGGVIAGKKAGCFVVGVKAGDPKQDLSKADIILDSLDQIVV